jgi:hypothetical protein
VIEEPDEAEHQRVMDELGAAAQLILARQWTAGSPQVRQGAMCHCCSSDEGPGGLP